MGDQLTKQWNSVIDSVYSGDKLDFRKMIENFDGHDLDAASEKIHTLMDKMLENGKLTGKQHAANLEAIDNEIKGLQRQAFIEKDLANDRAMWDRAHLIMMSQLADAREKAANAEKATWDEAARENERWSRTLDGLRKNNAIAAMEGDFRKLADVMKAADMEGFAKGFDNLHQARARIYEVTAAMEQQGRMSREQSEKMQKDINDYIQSVNDMKKAERDAADEKSKITKDALDETNRLRKAQDEYNASLNGMARNFHFSKLENDFRNLAAAMDSNDWSHFARGANDIEQMRRNIANTAGEMHRLGRMTDTEYGLILERTREVNQSFRDGERNLNGLRNAASRANSVFSQLGQSTKGLREHLQGFAGLNVFGDMIEGALEFLHNLDRIAVSASLTSMKLSSMASVAGSSLAGLFVIADDLGKTIGGLGALVPAFATGFGFMAYTAMTALQGMAKKYKTEILQWKEDMFTQLQKGLQPALDRFSKVMLPTLKKNLNDVAAAEGRLFGAILDGITASNGPDKMNLMFKRMNDAMDKSHAGVKSFINAWSTLGLVGTKYFDRFAVWFNKLGASFDAFITKAEKSGQIDKWIENGIKGFKDLGRTIDGTMGIFNAIADAARKAGNGGLSEFADKLQGIAAAMQSDRFQKTLTMFISGLNISTANLGEAIRNLGPAFESIMPSIKLSMINVSETVSTLIGYVGQIMSNPLVQKGLTDFTNGMKQAMDIMAPAVKPFADSLGNALTLLGKIDVSVAKIVTAFTVELSPIFDQMSIKVQTVLEPLSGLAVKAVDDLKPVIQAIDTYIVSPLADALKANVIPAVADFLGKAGPFLSKVVTDLGPSFKILVNDVLPPLIILAGQVLEPLGKVFDLFTPTLATTMDKIGTSLRNITNDIKVFKGELPIGELSLFKAFDPEKLKTDGEAARQSIKDNLSGRGNTSSWSEIISGAFWGEKPDVFWAKVWSKVGPSDAGAKKWDDSVGKWLEGARSGIVDLFRGAMEPGGFKEVTNKWFEDTIINPVKDAFGNFGKNNEQLSKDLLKNLDDWWSGIKGMAQDWLRGIFGFGKDTSKGDNAANITGGGGAGGKGSGVMGKITEDMLGNTTDPKPLIQQWFDGAVSAFNDGVANIGATIAQFASDVTTNWNNFWGGVGQTVSAVWQSVVDWVTTKAGEVKANIDTFVADFTTNWNNFWGGVGDKVSQTWNSVVTWITTKAGEIQTNVSNFITTVTANWNSFWSGVGDKVSQTWTFVTQWIAQQAGQIGANIGNFIGTVSSNWNSFWSGVGQKVQATWDFMWGWIAAKVGSIWASISGFAGQVSAGWSNLWNNVGQVASGAWNWIVSTISTGVNNVINWVSGLPGRISGAIGDGWSLLQNAGAAIMGGLRRGLEDAWSGVQSFVGTIADWIAQHKGPISYDKTLLVPAGQAIMYGLETSMRSSFVSVMDFVSQMADMMAGAFGSSKMYIAGKDASQGLADGLLANKSTIAAAYSDLGSLAPTSLGRIAVTGTGAAGGADRSSGTGAVMAPGAVQVSVTTAATDPNIVASKVSDTIDDALARFSAL
jgi:phage-related protein